MLRCTIEKYHAQTGEYWTNVYHILGSPDDLASGVNTAMLLVQAERAFHTTSVLFTKLRVDDGVPGTFIHTSMAVNQYGQRSVNGELMPLFVVLRVDLNAGSAPRPARKYYRGVLTEDDVSGMRIVNVSLLTSVVTALDDVLVQYGLHPGDFEISSSNTSPTVGMRQLRRGSKKKNTQSSDGT